jgi:adenine-specific DNA methylase
MDVMERGQTSLRKANKLWNIPLTSLSNHLNGKTTIQKMGPACVLTITKDEIVAEWVLAMQNVGLNITLT